MKTDAQNIRVSSGYIVSDRCIGCGTCIDICPGQAISINNSMAYIDQKKCLQCGACTTVCGHNAIVSV